MHRIDHATAAPGNLFTEGNPATSTPATAVTDDWLNDVQENISEVIEAAGIVLSKGNYLQLLEALEQTRLKSAGQVALTGTTTLTGASCGKQVMLGGVSNYVVTLPLASACAVGSRIQFMSLTSVGVTIQRQGTDQIGVNTATVTAINMLAGDTLTLESNGVNWYAVEGSAHLGSTAVFSASFAANGYQKLPSGLIVQWTAGSNVAAAGNQTITLPITYPNAHLRTFVSNLYASSAQNGGYGFISATASQVTVARNNADNGNGVTPLILSFGY